MHCYYLQMLHWSSLVVKTSMMYLSSILTLRLPDKCGRDGRDRKDRFCSKILLNMIKLRKTRKLEILDQNS